MAGPYGGLPEVADWAEVVTTALLGTDRRPLPVALVGVAAAGTEAPDPTQVLLAEAARHRAVTGAAAPLGRCPAPTVAPPDDLPDAPAAAQSLLGELLARPLPELVHAWLSAAVDGGVRAAAEHWTELALLTAHRPDYDRLLLARAIGAAGCWFLEQNPAWRRLADGVREAELVAVAAPETASPVPDEAEVRARPEVALTVAAPWPRALSVAALRVVLSGVLGWRATRYAASVGARIAVADQDLLQQAVDALPQDGRGAPPALRLLREALGAAEHSAAARAAIEKAFAEPEPPPLTGPPADGLTADRLTADRLTEDADDPH